MPLSVLRQIRKTAGQIACNTSLYDWSIGGHVPDRLVVKPVDPWPGNAEAGRWLCSGAFVIHEDQLELRSDSWEPYGIEDAWLEHMHGFTWLRDLRAYVSVGGGDAARRQARAMIGSWVHHYPRWSKMAWRPDITGERIAMWIALYDGFGASANDEFQDLFFESLARQARHVSRSIPGGLHGVALLKAAKGLLYAGLAFEGFENWAEQALDILEDEIDKQILGDGAHVSRSPEQLLTALQIFLDVRTALSSAAYPLPPKIQHAIDRMGPALRFFRYSDKSFGLFNGAQEGNTDFMDCVLGQANARGKALESLPCAGYERATLGRTTLMFDCGAPPAYPYDAQAHAAPLAFELSYGKERLFVSCGTHPTSSDWRDSLRATAAHSTAGIDNRNACEIRADGHIARRASTIQSLREDCKNAILLEATHDGYVPINGITHRRRLYLNDQGHDLRGEDNFTCATGIAQPHDVAIRFHIHPRVMVSLVNDGTAALLRMPGGIGWRFHHAGGVLALEDSVYLGSGNRPRKTKQIVIYGEMTEDVAQIKWALQREG